MENITTVEVLPCISIFQSYDPFLGTRGEEME